MICEQPHVPIRQLVPEHPAQLEQIIDKLLSKRPQDRYQTALSLHDDLQRLRLDLDEPRRKNVKRSSLRETSVAVLPFEIVGRSSPALEDFRDGLLEDLASQLTAIRHVRVAPRASTRAVAGQGIREIGKRLQVTSVVEGSIRYAGDRLRVIATLLEADGERTTLPPLAVDRSGDLTLAAQHDLAADIAERLSPGLAEPPDDLPTHDPEAFHAFKRGQHQFFTSCYTGGWRTAIEHFQYAIARDPRFALAHVAIATAYNFLGYYCLMKPNLAFTVAAQSAERALSIDDSFAPAYAELASVRFSRDWDWNGAEAHFRRALELDPTNAQIHIHYSWLLTLLDRIEAGLGEAQSGCTLAAGSPNAVVGRAHALYIAKRFDEAIDECSHALRVVPAYVFALHVRGLCHLSKGMGPEAIADLEAAAMLTQRTPFYLALLGLCYGQFGRRQRARDLVDELNQLSRDTYVHPQCYMFVYAGLRDDEKIAFQERSFEHGASPLNYLTPYLRQLYELDPQRPKRLEQMRMLAS